MAAAVSVHWPNDRTDHRLVVCTGGEPLLQLDEALIKAFHDQGFEVAVETNGTLPAPAGLDWICVSPKGVAPVVLNSGNELKLVYPQMDARPEAFEEMAFRSLFPATHGWAGSAKNNTSSPLNTACLTRKWRLGVCRLTKCWGYRNVALTIKCRTGMNWTSGCRNRHLRITVLMHA